jgi:3-oxoadipate enol-lactonase
MDQRHLVGRIRAPTLVIAGTDDFATPAADGRVVAEQIPQARYVELPAAHLSNVQAAPAFTQALMHFLTGRTE